MLLAINEPIKCFVLEAPDDLQKYSWGLREATRFTAAVSSWEPLGMS
jgi:hypothetical protein